jgi:hypothetical protein
MRIKESELNPDQNAAMKAFAGLPSSARSSDES